EDVPEDDIKKFFEEHKSEYNKPEEVRVSAIIVKKKDVAQKVAEEAKQPANQDNKAFRDLVAKYSEDEDSKARGGDLRFFAADTKEIPADVVKAAFTLQNQGNVSAPIQTDKGFYILKQTGRRKAITKVYDEVKGQIQNRLYRERRQKAMEEFVDGLKKNAKIEIKEAALGKVRVDTSTPPPVAPAEPGDRPPAGRPRPGPARAQAVGTGARPPAVQGLNMRRFLAPVALVALAGTARADDKPAGEQAPASQPAAPAAPAVKDKPRVLVERVAAV